MQPARPQEQALPLGCVCPAKTGKDRHKMSVKVANSRLITPSLRAAFYQQLLSRVSTFQELGKKVVREAECATDYRDADRLETLAAILSNIPIREYQLIGQYYLGWTEYLKGKSNQSIFEEVLEKSQTYKA